MKPAAFEMIVYRLVKDERVSLVRAGIIADTIANGFDERLEKGVALWLRGDTNGEFSVGELDAQSVMSAVGCGFLEALFIMNIALQSPARFGKILALHKERPVKRDE